MPLLIEPPEGRSVSGQKYLRAQIVDIFLLKFVISPFPPLATPVTFKLGVSIKACSKRNENKERV